MDKTSAVSVTENPQTPAAPPTDSVSNATENPQAPQQEELESTRFAAIAKKEAKLVQLQQQLKKEREELENQRQELTKKLTPFQEFEVLKSKDPIAALRGLGFSETDIFNWMASGGEKKDPTPEEIAQRVADEKLAAYKKEQEDNLKKEQEKRDQEVLGRFRKGLSSFLTKNAEKYEACADYGDIAVDAAYRLIEQVAKDTGGEVISLDEAFQTLEDYYEGEYKRMSNYKKFKRSDGTEVVIETSVPRETEKPASKSKTLSNAVTPTVASTVPVKKRETMSEKKERLANLLRSGIVLTK